MEGLTEGDRNQQVSDDHLEKISRSCCEQWKSLPSYLYLETIVASDIAKCPKEEGEKRHDFFKKWKQTKGSAATYGKLIDALLAIDCREDAEKVCEIMLTCVESSPTPEASAATVTASAATPPDTASTDVDSTQPDAPCSMAYLDSDTLEDLKLQLESDLENIIRQYSLYVSCIRESLQEKGVSAKDLCSDLMTMSAFNHTKQKVMLVSAHKAELEKAVDLNDIFNLLATEYASFFDYDIFHFILEKYQKKHRIQIGEEEFKYPDHLKAYLKRHKVEEFVEINPLLKKYSAASTELVLKIDIESTSRLSKLKKIKTTVAKILDLKSRTLRLLDIKDGCIVATFLLPTPVAEIVFNERTVLTEEQDKQFRALPILRLECNNCVLFDFTEDIPTEGSKTEVQVSSLKMCNFVNEPDEDLKCAICSFVAEDPIQHVKCGKLFCKKCLERERHEDDKPCPHCKTEGETFYPDTRGKQVIQKLCVKCNEEVKGCTWEGTVATLQEHETDCIYKMRDTPPQMNVRQVEKARKSLCNVFIDDSNLWVEGQKAQGKKLRDTDFDSRFRVDLGRFLTLVTKDRLISKAFLYGSSPPPNDTVWKAAEEHFTVNVFKRSGSGKAMEIQGAMARDIMKNSHDVNTAYIIVTGNRNLKPIIEEKLDSGVCVELWSWEDALAREFRQLANTHNFFEVNLLNTVSKKFGFTASMSTRVKKDIDAKHAIVYRAVPADESFKYMLVNHMHRLLRLFFMTIVESQTAGERDYIIEFPKTTPEVILKELRILEEFEYQPCSYPQYTTELKQHHQPILTTNRFDVLDVDSDYGSLPGSEYQYVEETVTPWHHEADVKDTFDDWTEKGCRKPGEMTFKQKRKKSKCQKGDHCPKASDCPYLHTEDEKRLFDKFPYIHFQFFKAKQCNKIDRHDTPDQKKWCAFAHDDQDSWCLKCKMYGHLTDKCKV